MNPARNSDSDTPNNPTRDISTVARTESDSNVSKSIGNYRLISVVGQGGMGTVWLAEQTEPIRRRVALKLVKSGMHSNQIAARFEVERQSLAMMDHPNIARVFDAGTSDDGQPYFVMEWVQGISITHYCDKNKLSINERLELFVPVCKAVQHAHQKGIIHRDLKPSNVLVCLVDNRPTAKVIDFGLAKALQSSLRLSDQSLYTEFGQVVGTIQYMSPEQAEMSHMDIDTRTDIYSLGVILYELLTGSTPIDSDTLKQEAVLKVLQFIQDVEPPRPSVRLGSSSSRSASDIAERRRIEHSRLCRILEGELDWIVMKALEKDRSRRYETANGFAEDVSRFLRGEPIIAKPPSARYRFAKFVRRNRGLVSAIGSIAALLLIGICTSSWFAYMSSKSEKRAQGESQRANDERQQAIIDRNRAVSAEAEVQLAKEKMEKLLADSNLKLASALWEKDRADEALELLDKIPSKHRDTEWYLARRVYNESDMTLYGHLGPVTGVCYDPTGKTIASSSEDKTIRIWDSTTGEQLQMLTGHTEPVNGVVFSRDGKRVLSASEDGTVRIWDMASKTGKSVFESDSGNCLQALFNNDETEIVIAVAETKNASRIVFVNPETREKRLTIRAPTLWDWDTRDISIPSRHPICLSPNGETLLFPGPWFSTCRIDVSSGTVDTFSRTNPGYAQSYAYHPKNELILLTATDGTTMLFSGDLKNEVNRFRDHRGAVVHAKFSPTGRMFANASYDRTICLWDTQGRFITTFSGHRGPVNQIDFHPSEERLVSASNDHSIKVWDARNLGSHLTTRIPGNRFIMRLKFNDDATRLAVQDLQDQIVVIDVGDATIAGECVHGLDQIYIASFDSNSDVLVQTRNEKVGRWNARSVDPINFSSSEFLVQNRESRKINSSQFLKSADSSMFMTAVLTSTSELTIYCVTLGPFGTSYSTLTCAIPSHDATSVATTLDQKHFLVKCKSCAYIVVDVETAALQRVSPEYDQTYVDERSKRLFTFTKSGKVYISQIGNAGITKVISGLSSPVYGANSTRTRLSVHTSDNLLHVLDVENATNTISFDLGFAGSVDFETNMSVIAVGSRNGLVKIVRNPRLSEASFVDGDDWLDQAQLIGNSVVRLHNASGESQTVRLSSVDDQELELPSESASLVQLPLVSPNASWLVDLFDGKVSVIDLKFKYRSDESTFRRAKARIDALWHANQAADCIKSNDWFAATCHWAWAIKGEPDNSEFYDNFHISYTELRKETLDRGSNWLVPTIIEEMTILNRGNLVPFYHSYSFVFELRERLEGARNATVSEQELQRIREFSDIYPLTRTLRTRALAEYRAGQFNAAITSATRSNEAKDLDNSTGHPVNFAVLAMASAKLGDKLSATKYRKLLDGSIAASQETGARYSIDIYQKGFDTFKVECDAVLTTVFPESLENGEPAKQSEAMLPK